MFSWMRQKHAKRKAPLGTGSGTSAVRRIEDRVAGTTLLGGESMVDYSVEAILAWVARLERVGAVLDEVLFDSRQMFCMAWTLSSHAGRTASSARKTLPRVPQCQGQLQLPAARRAAWTNRCSTKRIELLCMYTVDRTESYAHSDNARPHSHQGVWRAPSVLLFEKCPWQ